jgi:succinyl-CoA synthetase alpha subunit
VVITEGIPVADTAEFYAAARDAGVRLIGPNCPGIISPGKSNVGIIPAHISRSRVTSAWCPSRAP